MLSTKFILPLLLILASSALAVDVRPVSGLTGGSVRTLDVDDTCATDTRTLRHGTRALDNEVLESYGLPAGQHPDYEIDHLIPLCLGGSDDASNLWPQPRRSIEPKWNAEAKDRLEAKLCQMVCSGALEISDEQEEIATDWTAAYRKYFGR